MRKRNLLIFVALLLAGGECICHRLLHLLDDGHTVQEAIVVGNVDLLGGGIGAPARGEGVKGGSQGLEALGDNV